MGVTYSQPLLLSLPSSLPLLLLCHGTVVLCSPYCYLSPMGSEAVNSSGHGLKPLQPGARWTLPPLS